jgi:23S rRNA (uracil1939-C5)-methyltransferase
MKPGEHLRRGDELTLKVERVAFEGKSVARINGLVAFVSGAVPGDEVVARVVRTKKQHIEADTISVLTPSPLRVNSRCKHFGVCGGCRWQHVDYAAQLEFKRRHVVDALERIGGFRDVDVGPSLASNDIYFYRNKMEFSFGERWLTTDDMNLRSADHPRFALGLHIPERFDRVLDIDECHLQSPVSNDILSLVRSFCIQRDLPIYSTKSHTGYLRNLAIRQSRGTADLMVNVVTLENKPEIMRALSDELLSHIPSITTIVNNITARKAQVATGEQEVVYHGPGIITERIGKRLYHVSANSFFQTNTLQAERLYDVAAECAGLRKDDLVFDLYSGTGTIALHIADRVKEVVGIEAVESAIHDARRNALLNGVSNCSFVFGDLKDWLLNDPTWRERYSAVHVIMIDPPRSGMHEKVVLEIAKARPERIVYISCNPATQARDLKLLCSSAPYRITRVQPVDMFPHTWHIENVVGLSLNI